MPDKLTDSEIAKAFEIFVNSVGKGLVFANVDMKKDGINEFKHIDLSFDEIFDLINHLEAENEELKVNSDSRQININTNINIPHIKSEAYKEFAENFVKRANKTTIIYVADTTIQEQETGWYQISIADFNNLLKELVGEDDA